VLEVACTADRRFLPDCGVMLASLVRLHEAESVRVHFLHDGSLAREELSSLRAIVAGAGAQFELVPVSPRRAPSASERFPASIWYRALLGELLPSLPRVLYIDADALITAPLGELWRTELAGQVLGAVTNGLYASMVPRIRDELGVPGVDAYFNSGVLLIDLEAWRAEELTERVLAFAGRHPGLTWPDQDALNALAHGRRLALHPRWNATPSLWQLPQRHLPFPPAQVREAAADPAIVHFVGPYKPLHYRFRHPYRGEWFRQLERTPWRDRPIEGRTPAQVLLRALPVFWGYRVDGWLARARAAQAARRAGGRLRRALG
jgi:UDP-glucose/galactose:(glucosyl)LPS alpha-1,2-glucosyl/galactosyltransferase